MTLFHVSATVRSIITLGRFSRRRRRTAAAEGGVVGPVRGTLERDMLRIPFPRRVERTMTIRGAL